MNETLTRLEVVLDLLVRPGHSRPLLPPQMPIQVLADKLLRDRLPIS
ncbi:hypothetical protein GS469_05735 [Rhodococcus hoagii]|nr:hypothetical protein [Prescottella equi]